MAANVKHVFNSTKGDGADPTLVRPSNWNDSHKVENGAVGQALVWDDAETNKVNWGRVPRRNYVYNGSFELWSAGTTAAPTGWSTTGAGGTIARDAANFKRDTYGATYTRSGNDVTLQQTLISGAGGVMRSFGLVTDITYFQGKAVTLGCWIKTATAGVARIQVDDGVGSTTSSFHNGDGTFQFIKVQHTVASNATSLSVLLVIVNGDASATFDGVILDICGPHMLDDYYIDSLYSGARNNTFVVGSVSTQAQNTTQYYGPYGGSTTEANASFKVPYKCYAKNLRVLLDSAPAGGQNFTINLRKAESTDTGLTVAVTSAARNAEDLTNLVELDAGDTISLKSVASATSGNRVVHITFEIVERP